MKYVVIYETRYPSYPEVAAIGPFSSIESADRVAEEARLRFDQVRIVEMLTWRDFRFFFGVKG
jgi:hypothetical protein